MLFISLLIRDTWVVRIYVDRITYACISSRTYNLNDWTKLVYRRIHLHMQRIVTFLTPILEYVFYYVLNWMFGS